MKDIRIKAFDSDAELTARAYSAVASEAPGGFIGIDILGEVPNFTHAEARKLGEWLLANTKAELSALEQERLATVKRDLESNPWPASVGGRDAQIGYWLRSARSQAERDAIRALPAPTTPEPTPAERFIKHVEKDLANNPWSLTSGGRTAQLEVWRKSNNQEGYINASDFEKRFPTPSPREQFEALPIDQVFRWDSLDRVGNGNVGVYRKTGKTVFISLGTVRNRKPDEYQYSLAYLSEKQNTRVVLTPIDG